MSLLSLVWWGQRLTGVTANAVALAVLVSMAVGMLSGGLWWLRADARADERSAWSVRMSKAQAAAEKDAREKLAASERVALSEAEKWRADLEASEAARMELEKLLSATQAKAVCFPVSMVEALNR